MENRYQRYREKSLAQSKRWQKENIGKVKSWARRYRTWLRKEVVKAYGGVCVCCGEHRWKFLTLDHPDGNGQKDREQHRMQVGQLYAWIKDQGYPKGYYRLLCMNCNWVRRYDVCPHEQEKDPNYVPDPDWTPKPKSKFLVKKEPVVPRVKAEPFVPTLVKRKDPKPIGELKAIIETIENKPKITRSSISAQTYQKEEWVDPV